MLSSYKTVVQLRKLQIEHLNWRLSWRLTCLTSCPKQMCTPTTHSILERWPSKLLVNTSFEPLSPETLISCWTALVVKVLPYNRVFLKVKSVDHLYHSYLRCLLKSDSQVQLWHIELAFGARRETVIYTVNRFSR